MWGKRFSVAKLTPVLALSTCRNCSRSRSERLAANHHLGGGRQGDPVEEVVEQFGHVAGAAVAHVEDLGGEALEHRADSFQGLGLTAEMVSVPASAALAPPEMPASR